MTADTHKAPSSTFEIKIERVDQAIHTAPVIHVDGAQGLIGNDRAIRFNFFQDRLVAGVGGPTTAASIERVVCARIVMPPAVFKELADWLSRYAAEAFKQEGQ